MTSVMPPALAAAAVILLSGCQSVTVRHYHPAPVAVIETHSTVHVDHHHRYEPRPPRVVVVRPAPPVRVVTPTPPYPRDRHAPGHNRPPRHEEEQRQRRQPEHPPQHEERQRHQPERPPQHDEQRERRQPERQPQHDEQRRHQPERPPRTERALPLTPQAKGLFGATAQAAARLRQEQADSPEPAAPPAARGKPQQPKAEKSGKPQERRVTGVWRQAR